jgi:signal transduction histidine kinase
MNARMSAAGEFELRIEDDGRGFGEADAKRKSGRGVANIRARASMIDAETAWVKGPDGGTSFSLRKSVGEVRT